MKKLIFAFIILSGLQGFAIGNESGGGAESQKSRCDGQSATLGVGDRKYLAGSNAESSKGQGPIFIGTNAVQIDIDSSKAKIFASQAVNEEFELSCSFLSF